MTADLIVVGKTDFAAVNSLVEMYLKRINFYLKFSIITLPHQRNTRNLTPKKKKKQEGELLLRQFGDGDYVVLLDERGCEYRSTEFAAWLQKRMNSGVKRVVFVIGGAYGFSQEVYERANSMVSLSRMTFSHQIVRAIFMEQIYRGLAILHNDPYHHEG